MGTAWSARTKSDTKSDSKAVAYALFDPRSAMQPELSEALATALASGVLSRELFSWRPLIVSLNMHKDGTSLLVFSDVEAGKIISTIHLDDAFENNIHVADVFYKHALIHVPGIEQRHVAYAVDMEQPAPVAVPLWEYYPGAQGHNRLKMGTPSKNSIYAAVNGPCESYVSHRTETVGLIAERIVNVDGEWKLAHDVAQHRFGWHEKLRRIISETSDAMYSLSDGRIICSSVRNGADLWSAPVADLVGGLPNASSWMAVIVFEEFVAAERGMLVIGVRVLYWRKSVSYICVLDIRNYARTSNPRDALVNWIARDDWMLDVLKNPHAACTVNRRAHLMFGNYIVMEHRIYALMDSIIDGMDLEIRADKPKLDFQIGNTHWMQFCGDLLITTPSEMYAPRTYYVYSMMPPVKSAIVDPPSDHPSRVVISTGLKLKLQVSGRYPKFVKYIYFREYRMIDMAGVSSDRTLLATPEDERKQTTMMPTLKAGRKGEQIVARPCHICGQPGYLTCSICNMIGYCSEDCQAVHWIGGHRNDCQKVAK